VVIGREKPGETRFAVRPPIEAPALKAIAKAITAKRLPAQCGVTEIARVANGAEPWMFEAPHQLRLVRRPFRFQW
jgi:hypothetical protein